MKIFERSIVIMLALIMGTLLTSQIIFPKTIAARNAQYLPCNITVAESEAIKVL